MKRTIVLFTVLTFVSLFKSSVSDLTGISRFIRNQAKNTTFRELFRDHVKRFSSDAPPHDDFPCRAYPSAKRKITVHRLTPADINVVAALGDSITAGFGVGVTDPLKIFTLTRGYAFSIGGDGFDEGHMTIPNIIRKYNPNVKGFSLGIGSVAEEDSHLNVAVIGDTFYGMGRQATELIQRMRDQAEGVDFDNDWKMITILIGANSLSRSCALQKLFTAENFINEMKQALDILHKNVPKAFVNVLLPPNVTEASKIEGDPFCSMIRPIWCQCSQTPRQIQTMMTNYRLFKEALYELINTGRYDTRDDFTVVIQPFLENTAIPRHKNGTLDYSFLAIDCYHPSKLGHSKFAVALWNNMIEPVGLKRHRLKSTDRPGCPSVINPYFYTRINSRPFWKMFG